MGFSDDFKRLPQPMTSFPKLFGSICVVSPQFVASHYLDMLSGKKDSDGSCGVTDVNGNLMFKVKRKLLSVHGKRLFVDAVGNRILTFQKKVIFSYIF